MCVCSCVGYRGSYSRLCHGRASRQKILWAKVVRANEGCCLSPRLWPFFYLFTKKSASQPRSTASAFAV